MAYSYFNTRRKLEVGLLFFLILFGFAAIGSEWIGWATMASILAILIMIDFMFMDDSAFMFEPDIKNYQRRTGNPLQGY